MKLPRNETIGLGLLVGGLVALALLLPGGPAVEGAAPLRVAFGWAATPLVLALVAGGIALLFADRMGWQVRWTAIAAAEAGFLVGLTALHLAEREPWLAAHAGRGGGLVGWALSQLLLAVFPAEMAWALVILAAGLALVVFWRALPPAWTARWSAWIGRVAAFLKASRPDRPAAPPARAAGRSAAPARLEKAAAAWIAAGRWLAVGRAAARGWIGRGLTALLPARAAPADAPAGRQPPAPATGRAAKPARPAGRAVAPDGRPSATDGQAATASPSRAAAQPAPAGHDAGRSSRIKARPDYLPPIGLLRGEAGNRSNQSDARQRAQLLKQTLAEFGVPVEVVSIKEGPTVTQFGLEPGEIVRELRNGEVVRRRVSVHRIQQLSNDLALALAAASIRIEAPVPGRPYVGVEIPNTSKATVTLRGLLESPEFARARAPLAVALGRDVAGDPVIIDLARLPHLLIAGATGSGKSVCINAIVSSLLMNNGPEQVRFLMVDPKMVELPIYNGIPHLLGPVITDVAQVPAALAWLTLQMDDRYRLFADRGVRNIEEYNRKLGRSRSAEPLPYIILVIDELADLMMTAAYDVERQICRLAQMSRATGIHLVLATQRPSVDVITGLIKANFPARIAFAVTSQVDSRVILDTPGAEKLLGRGDMLYMAPDSARLARIQGCFVSDEEIDAIVHFWKQQRAEADPADDALPEAPWAGMAAAAEERDELLDRALELIQSKRQISTSLLQRQLRIGYPRAARLMEQLEEMGVVGPDEGGGRSREVLIRKGEEME